MTAKRLNFVLAVLLVMVFGTIIVVRRDASQPNWQFLAAMKHSPAYQAFEVNTDFANGRTQQPPVPGTIPRGELPLHFEATKEDALRAGEELFNPYVEAIAAAEQAASVEQSLEDELVGDSLSLQSPLDDIAALDVQTEIPDPHLELQVSIARGGEFFRTYCVSCHGPGGAGDGPVAQRGFPPPPPLPTGNSTRMKDGQIFHILTYGQGSMPGMTAMLSRDRRWDLVNFVRTLQTDVVPEPEDDANPLESAPGDVPEVILDAATSPPEDTRSDTTSTESPPTHTDSSAVEDVAETATENSPESDENQP